MRSLNEKGRKATCTEKQNGIFFCPSISGIKEKHALRERQGKEKIVVLFHLFPLLFLLYTYNVVGVLAWVVRT